MVSSQILRRFPGFSRALERSVRSLAVISQEKHIKAGQEIFKECAPAEELCFIVEGEVDLSFELRDGKAIVDTLVPGDMLCWSAIVEPYRTTATAEARTDVRLVAVSGPELLRMFERDNSLAFYLSTEVARCLSRRLKGAHVQLAASYS